MLSRDCFGGPILERGERVAVSHFAGREQPNAVASPINLRLIISQQFL